jgi:hypothetical protein
MRRPRHLALALLAAVSLFDARAGAAHRPQAPGAIRGGEAFTFQFSVGAIQAGRARLSVGTPTRAKGGRLVAVQGDAQSAPWLALLAKLEDEYKVVLDADTLAPRKVSCIERGLRDRRFDVTLSPAGAAATRIDVDLERPGEKRHLSQRLPGRALDPVAALFTLRAAPLRDGDVIQMVTFDGPAFYHSVARVAGRAEMTHKGHRVAVVRVEIEARPVGGQPPRHVTLWLSDDEQRIPYRVSGDTDFGRCDLDLTSYKAP